MNLPDIYLYSDYRKYLRACLPSAGAGRGGTSRLALHLGCQPGFVSLVLGGKGHFSLESAMLISEFLGHPEEDREFFLLLVQRGRAGSKKLEEYFERKINAVLSGRKKIASRIKQAKKPLSTADQAIYYGDWVYTALHMALLIPELQTVDALKRYLRVPATRLNQALSFLFRTGLAQQVKDKVVVGATRMHLPAQSSLINRHHLNWRIKAMEAIDAARADDLHYTSVMSISRSGAEKVRELILTLIQDADQEIVKAKDEEVYSFIVDYYLLSRPD
jgi:uncharacterized protein (TIGR02147 family)